MSVTPTRERGERALGKIRPRLQASGLNFSRVISGKDLRGAGPEFTAGAEKSKIEPEKGRKKRWMTHSET